MIEHPATASHGRHRFGAEGFPDGRDRRVGTAGVEVAEPRVAHDGRAADHTSGACLENPKHRPVDGREGICGAHTGHGRDRVFRHGWTAVNGV